MHNKLILFFFYFSVIFSENTFDYAWPTNASKVLTTVFGEERSRRFHAGIDVRTYGKIGDPLYAVQNGYISRIKISPDGYGKTLYLKLDDGNTAVYAHIDEFNELIKQKVKKIRLNTNQNFFDSYLKKNEIRFFKGETIAYAGDTGSLSGPHLHFEIRDKNNKPINPLKSIYAIEDTLKPIAKSIAFVPLDENCWINGIQDYSIFNLQKLNDYKYVIQDTISVLGNFGLAIEVEDKINTQPFNYNIYKIELLIDNKLMYKIKFDEYNIENDHLIYNEIDFHLLTSLSKNFHRLYVNNNENLDFIDNQSKNGLNVNENYHYLNINISDINNNQIQIQGIIKGDIAFPSKLNFKDNQIYSETGFNNMKLYYDTRYENSRLIPASFSQIDYQNILIDIPNSPYDVLKFNSKNSNGLKSKNEYLNLKYFDPYKIKGEFHLKHFDRGLQIQFIENTFSGYNAIMILESKKDTMSFPLYRNKKRILSTTLINPKKIKDLNNVKIVYECNPQIVIEKQINGKVFNKGMTTNLIHDNFEISSFENSFYEDVFITVEDTSINIPSELKIIEEPIKILPKNISFKNYCELSYNNSYVEGAFFNYNKKKNKWYFMKNKDENVIKTHIFSGGIFAILNEKIKPVINNVIPANGSNYKASEMIEFSFNIKDNHSGINYNNIIIKIDGKVLFYDYIKYRDLVKCELEKELSTGRHIMEIYAEDRLKNSIYKKNVFFIK